MVVQFSENNLQRTQFADKQIQDAYLRVSLLDQELILFVYFILKFCKVN